MLAAEFMTCPAVAATPQMTLSTATALLQTHRLGAVPVVDERRQLVGIVSVGDLLRGRLGVHRPALPASSPESLLTVADVMTRDVVALPDTTDESEYRAAMLDRKIKTIPVLRDGCIVGVVTVTDLLHEHVHDIDQGSPGVGPAAGRAIEPSDRTRDALPADHRGLGVLSLTQCVQRLRQAPLGRLAFIHNGEPVVMPVNHGMSGLDIVFRTTWGAKVQWAQRSGPVAFEVDGIDEHRRAGWSVMATGTASIVYESAELERLEALGVSSWVAIGHDTFWVRIRAQQITGREIVLVDRPS